MSPQVGVSSRDGGARTVPRPLFLDLDGCVNWLQFVLSGFASSSSDRAAQFNKKCRSAGICGVSLHSYRYAWAERARAAGYPERYAQEALGHKSASIHRAYAKKARVEPPPLEEFEKLAAEGKVIPLPARTPTTPLASDTGIDRVVAADQRHPHRQRNQRHARPVLSALSSLRP